MKKAYSGKHGSMHRKGKIARKLPIQSSRISEALAPAGFNLANG
jgi:hypothetical protein